MSSFIDTKVLFDKSKDQLPGPQLNQENLYEYDNTRKKLKIDSNITFIENISPITLNDSCLVQEVR